MHRRLRFFICDIEYEGMESDDASSHSKKRQEAGDLRQPL
jgi:hypothetical protein